MGHVHHGRRPPNYKKWFLECARFAVLIVLSAILSAYLQQWYETYSKRGRVATNSYTEQKTSTESPLTKEIPVSEMERLYKANLEKIFQGLREKTNFRMVRFELPARFLAHHRTIASLQTGHTYQLRSRSDVFPVMALPIRTKKLLDHKLIVYLNPTAIQKMDVSNLKLPFPAKQLGEFILVPDLTGDNAASFRFESN